MITKNSSGSNLNANYEQTVTADSRSFLAKLFIDGTELDCGIASFEVTKGSCGSTTEFSVGNLISSSLTAEVKDLHDDVKNEIVEVRVGLDISGTYEWVTVGFFKITEVKKTVYTTTLTGQGKIATASGTDFSVPSTQSLTNIASRLSIGLGCTVTLDTNIDGSKVITEPMNGLTNYQALQILTATVGGYAIDTYDGNVKVCLFSDAPTASIEAHATDDGNGNVTITATGTYAVDDGNGNIDIVGSHAIDDGGEVITTTANINSGMMTTLPDVEENNFTITGVRVVVSEASSDDDGEIPAVGYEQGTVNLLCQNKYMTSALFNDMASNIIGYSYRPATINLSLGDPRIEGNDVLAVQDVGGSIYIVPCHVLKHIYDGGLRTMIESVRATNDANSIGTLTPMQTLLAEINSGMVSAKTEAKKAKTIASNTNQYFWFVGTGTDTGAHITEVPQEDWNDSTSPNYHSGGNLLARSNGIAVRDGLTELSSFGSNGTNIGRTDSCHLEITPNSMTLLDAEGRRQMTANLLNDQNTGLAVINYTVRDPYIDGTTTTFTTTFLINEILECYDVTTGDPVTVTKTGDREITFAVAPQVGSVTRVRYNTLDPVYDFGLGTRTDGATRGSDSIVIGNDNEASSYLCIAIGAKNKVNSNQAIGIGRHIIASSHDQIAMGRWNVEDNQNKYGFIIGNGTADNARSNALAIAWNGDLYLKNQKLVDYVIEEGTGGSAYWKYRKWASGRIEAWYSRSFNTQYSFDTRGGSSSYYWTNSNWISYNAALPSGLFTSISNVSLNVGSNAYLNQCVPSYTTSNIVVRLWMNYSSNPIIYTVSLYVVGE